ncbi:hypothetical protein [Algicola sagamiensis]|uniref:hypothetical protein n=1 Tax=Algicola sagamiensis TaxID=163869 RepID=UPI001B7FC4DD|nr:hypothetical protein [Algicola sagamiensis]
MNDSLDGYFPADVVAEVFGNRPATTTLMDCIFLPGSRLPRDLANQMAGDESLIEQQILANKPLLSTRQEKPYWKKGANKREFDAVTLQVYSAVCLVADRHLLEGIVSIGGMYEDVSGLTLRQAIELSKLNVMTEYLPSQYQSLLDTRMFSGIYDYFLVDFSDLFLFLDLKNAKPNKKTVLQRLQRLSQMLLVLDYENEGKVLTKYNTKIRLVDHSFIPLLVPDGIRSKGSITADTMTHLLVGVHRTFTASLLQEGSISRKRFLEVYPQLSGNHSVTDFAKYLDQHKREFLHGKYLSDLIRSYYENKARITKKHSTTLINNTMKEVLQKQDILSKDFNLILKKEMNSNRTDYQLIYIGDEDIVE